MVYKESLKFRTVKSATIESKLGMRPVFDKSSKFQGPLWLWSHGSWIYNYLCNQYISPLWVWILLRVRCATLCDKVCQWLAAGRWFSPGTTVSSTNKTVHHDITKILLKVALNTIKPTKMKIPDCKGHPNNICVWTCRQVLARAAKKLM
jgi:hypothetical protein